MFDQVDPAGYDAWLEERAAALDLIDEAEMFVASPVVSDAEFAAWAAELDGAAAVSTAVEVIGAGERGDVTPALVSRLAAIDPAELDDAARVGLAVCWSRVRNYADAMVGRTVAVQIAATSAVGGPRDVVRIEAERLAAGELAAALRVRGRGGGGVVVRIEGGGWAAGGLGGALRLGTGAGAGLVFVADALARQLPATAAAVASGAVSWAKAATLAYATASLDTPTARAVEAKVLPFA